MLLIQKTEMEGFRAYLRERECSAAATIAHLALQQPARIRLPAMRYFLTKMIGGLQMAETEKRQMSLVGYRQDLSPTGITAA